MKLMYVAGPYRGQTKEEIELNVCSAKQVAKLCADKGWMPVTPHLNTFGFEFLCPDIKDEFWLNGTLELMNRCDAVVTCPGWEFSSGSVNEVNTAIKKKMVIYYNTKDVPYEYN